MAAAAEKLPPEVVADRPSVARRVLRMGAGEATQRIGPHRHATEIQWEWTSAAGTLRLKEWRELRAKAGGVAGDFLATLRNSNELGLEVVRVGGRVFARSTYGAQGAGRFRERRRDRGMAERMRDEAFGAIRDFDELFGGRVKLSAQGTVSHEGRTAWRYVAALDEPRVAEAAGLPPVSFAKGGPDATTARRLAFAADRRARALSGELLVDAETSVVLRGRLDGRLGVGGGDGGVGAAELRLVVEVNVTAVGTEPEISVPKDFLPDEDKPPGIAAALSRFGIARGGADGGTTAAPGTLGSEEPPDE